MDAGQREAGLRRIAQVARWTAIRLRVADGLVGVATMLPVPLLTAIICLATIKVRRLDWSQSRRYLIAIGVSACVVLGVAVYQLVRRRPHHEGAIALDRVYGLHDRLTNALSFWGIPQHQRTPLMELAMEDGAARAAGLRPRKAAPLRTPPLSQLGIVVLLVGILTVVLMLEVPIRRTIARAQTIDAVTLTADDMEMFREVSKELAERRQDAEMRTAIDRFNQLLEDIANKRLDRTEAFRRMEALERDLLKGTEADRKALEEGLSQIAEELRKSELSKSTADALGKKDLPKAEQEMHALSKAMRDKKVDKAALERLRQALEKASKGAKDRISALQQRRGELQKEREDLLKKRAQQDGGLAEQEERLLRNKERSLERLEREMEQQRSAERQLERLDRELAQAAEDLMRDLGLSANDLDRGAEDLNRMGREQMTDQEKEELRQRIQELRELLRQQGQGGKMRMARLRRFSQAARGQRGQGRGQQGQDQGEEEGQDGQQGQGNGQQGQGNGSETWVIGPNGQRMLVVGRGSGSTSGGSQGSQAGGEQPGGDGKGQGGKDWGTGHDSNLTGKATNSRMKTQDVSASTLDTGQGPNRSEVIYGAAERGFVGRGYKKVFTEYHTAAERAIQKEDIPAGYRFYVQRYFQLIRPRGED